jgi:hypothetical protein
VYLYERGFGARSNALNRGRLGVYGAVQLVEQIGGLALAIAIAPHRRNRPMGEMSGRNPRGPQQQGETDHEKAYGFARTECLETALHHTRVAAGARITNSGEDTEPGSIDISGQHHPQSPD